MLVRVDDGAHEDYKADTLVVRVNRDVLLVDNVLDHLHCVGEVRPVHVYQKITQNNDLKMRLNRHTLSDELSSIVRVGRGTAWAAANRQLRT